MMVQIAAMPATQDAAMMMAMRVPWEMPDEVEERLAEVEEGDAVVREGKAPRVGDEDVAEGLNVEVEVTMRCDPTELVGAAAAEEEGTTRGATAEDTRLATEDTKLATTGGRSAAVEAGVSMLAAEGVAWVDATCAAVLGVAAAGDVAGAAVDAGDALAPVEATGAAEAEPSRFPGS